MMPHNRTRLWVGLAIVAVTIPAVAQYYYGSASSTPVSVPSEVAASDETAMNGRLASVQTDRDYLGEVTSVLSRGGSRVSSADADREALPVIYGAPVEAVMAEVRPIGQQTAAVEEEPLPVVAARVPRTTLDPDEEEVGDEPEASPGLSDRTVYQLVVDNLPENDRDTFVQAWAVMTPEERASLLDEWRANLNN